MRLQANNCQRGTKAVTTTRTSKKTSSNAKTWELLTVTGTRTNQEKENLQSIKPSRYSKGNQKGDESRTYILGKRSRTTIPTRDCTRRRKWTRRTITIFHGTNLLQHTGKKTQQKGKTTTVCRKRSRISTNHPRWGKRKGRWWLISRTIPEHHQNNGNQTTTHEKNHLGIGSNQGKHNPRSKNRSALGRTTPFHATREIRTHLHTKIRLHPKGRFQQIQHSTWTGHNKLHSILETT